MTASLDRVIAGRETVHEHKKKAQEHVEQQPDTRRVVIKDKLLQGESLNVLNLHVRININQTNA